MQRPGSHPSADVLLIPQPLVSEPRFQLRFLPPDEEIDEREMENGKNKGAGRTQQAPCPEENEHVSAKVQGIPTESVRAGSDEHGLRRERDHLHPVFIEDVRCPHPQQEASGHKQAACDVPPRERKLGTPRIESSRVPT